MTSAAVEPQPAQKAHVQDSDALGSSNVQVVRGPIVEYHSRFSMPFQRAQDQHQLPAGRKLPCLQLHQRRLGKQDASSKFVKVRHRSWMRIAKFAELLIIL